MYKQLTPEQRYTIYVLLQKKCSKKSIAEAIGVHPSTITRELRRNSSQRGVYKWDWAQKHADKRSRRQPGNRAISKAVWGEVRRHLVNDQWSPEQISGYLARDGIRISHDVQPRTGLFCLRLLRRQQLAVLILRAAGSRGPHPPDGRATSIRGATGQPVHRHRTGCPAAQLRTHRAVCPRERARPPHPLPI